MGQSEDSQNKEVQRQQQVDVLLREELQIHRTQLFSFCVTSSKNIPHIFATKTGQFWGLFVKDGEKTKASEGTGRSRGGRCWCLSLLGLDALKSTHLGKMVKRILECFISSKFYLEAVKSSSSTTNSAGCSTFKNTVFDLYLICKQFLFWVWACFEIRDPLPLRLCSRTLKNPQSLTSCKASGRTGEQLHCLLPAPRQEWTEGFSVRSQAELDIYGERNVNVSRTLKNR